MPLLFPEDFTWGVATSAYQIEGGRTEGKGDSIWDRFSDEGRMRDPGDVACDHYHRWREDVALLSELGVGGYRLSLSWSRILPEGVGAVNTEGVEFYRRVLEALASEGIAPWVTLYHWDLPQALQDRGGWPARSTVDAFLEYVEVVVETLGDLVSHWMTHNEPWVATILGHVEGVFAPGMADWRQGLAAGHHILLSHGRAARLLKDASPTGQVGIALDCRPSRPAGSAPADLDAHRHFDGVRNRWFFDPVLGQGYPEDILEDHRRRGRLGDGTPEFVRAGDLEEIAAPLDFLGVNYYTSISVSAGADESEDSGVPPGPDPPAGHTEMGWPVTPYALTDFLRRVHADYRSPPLVVTENGASYSDGPDPEGRVRDERRIEYLRQHIRAVHDALRSGVPVTGYFVWSLLDNLEWTSGFSQRFGLVWVDHATGDRIPKDSFRWYREVIARGGLAED